MKQVSAFRIRVLSIVIICLFVFQKFIVAQDSADKGKSKKVIFFREENASCLSCHGKNHYEFWNSDSTKKIRCAMCPDNVIDTALFYTSNHKSFKCVDCHSEEYSKYPHNANLKTEMAWTCLDCHGNDEAYAKFHFEEVTAQFEKSIHYQADKDAFTCWRCHDPHTYKTMARLNGDVGKTVLYDNNICLSCHANVNKLQILTDKDKANVIAKHDWLPNQELHFKNVRCVECHSRVNDTLMVSHLVLPKQKAVHLCEECHSQNSLLMASLYKYKAKESRQKYGFFNSVILNQSFVIGANRNYYLNVISIGLASIVFSLIIIHAVFRILKNR